MTRVAVASALVIALATGVWLLWPDDEQPPSTTVPIAASSTTIPSTTSSSPGTTSTTNHVVDSVEEAETILRDLWFGWFEGIYNEDEERIREVVIREEDVAEATRQFGDDDFAARPAPQDITLNDTAILRSDSECLAIWVRLGTTGFAEGESEAVHVLRWTGAAWMSLSLWRHQNDLWEVDCDVWLP